MAWPLARSESRSPCGEARLPLEPGAARSCSPIRAEADLDPAVLFRHLPRAGGRALMNHRVPCLMAPYLNPPSIQFPTSKDPPRRRAGLMISISTGNRSCQHQSFPASGKSAQASAWNSSICSYHKVSHTTQTDHTDATTICSGNLKGREQRARSSCTEGPDYLTAYPRPVMQAA